MSQFDFGKMFIALESFEIGLNVAGYIPVLGSVTSLVRLQYARIEAVAGAIFLLIGAAAHPSGALARLYCDIGVTLIGHAVLNLARSDFEVVPFLPLVTTLPYDILAVCCVWGRFFSYIS